MERLKIAFCKGNTGEVNDKLIIDALDDPAMLELCSPVFCEEAEAFRKLDEGSLDALVLASPSQTIKDATEVIVTDKTNILVLGKEPTADDIVKFRDILERDFDLQLPRIAIVQETAMQVPDLSSQVTTEQGINTYGPYTVEQIMAEDTILHFDGIIVADKNLASTLVKELAEEAPVRFFAGRETVVTAIWQPVTQEEEEGLSDVSWLTHPFFVAADVIRNREFYDEARLNPLPKLYRDKREDRRKDEDKQANENENAEKES